jgi:hypothetical protein
MLKIQRLIALLFAAVLLSMAATAQSSHDISPSDAKEIHDYTLSMDKLHKMAAATTALMDYSKHHPEMKDAGDSKNLDQMVANIQKYPEAVAAIRQNGMSPREYAVCMMTLMETAMAVGFKKAGTYKEYPPQILETVSKANLDFAEQHWDEIQNLMPKDSGDQ